MENDDPTLALKAELLALTYRCPKGQYAPHCPFALLAGLSHPSRKSVLDRMDRDALLGLFDLVPCCSCPADPARTERPALHSAVV
jgi:hypothetical protein